MVSPLSGRSILIQGSAHKETSRELLEHSHGFVNHLAVGLAQRGARLVVRASTEEYVADGEPRTSLITFPADGRMPALSAEGQKRKDEYDAFRSQFAQYDHPELRPLAERCVIYYGSSRTGVLGSPMTPTRAYNNNLTIVQNADHVLIRAEMIHDVRIIRLGEPDELPKDMRLWFGDSWGHWEGNTLVVETTNQHLDQGINVSGSMIRHSEDLRVLERFTRVDDDTILYEFEIDDPRTYSEPWGGQIPWEKFDQQILEYACHEGNYALSNILSGARYQEMRSPKANGKPLIFFSSRPAV